MIKKILVLDDDCSVLTVIRRMLELNGYHVLTAADSASALEKIKTLEFDLIISDLNLSENHSGIDFFNKAVELNRNYSGKFIFVSGNFCENGWMEQIKKLHLENNCIAKPLEYRSFIERINNYFGQ